VAEMKTSPMKQLAIFVPVPLLARSLARSHTLAGESQDGPLGGRWITFGRAGELPALLLASTATGGSELGRAARGCRRGNYDTSPRAWVVIFQPNGGANSLAGVKYTHPIEQVKLGRLVLGQNSGRIGDNSICFRLLMAGEKVVNLKSWSSQPSIGIRNPWTIYIRELVEIARSISAHTTSQLLWETSHNLQSPATASLPWVRREWRKWAKFGNLFLPLLLFTHLAVGPLQWRHHNASLELRGVKSGLELRPHCAETTMIQLGPLPK